MRPMASSIYSNNRQSYFAKTGHREFFALDPESLAVLQSRGPLQPGIGRMLGEILQPQPSDAIAVGVDPRRSIDAIREFPRCLLKTGSGPSGGERALIDALDIAHLATRFDGITIGSGDGAFIGTAQAARRAGLRVTVVSWKARLSNALAAVAHDIIYLDNFIAHPGCITTRPRTLRGPDHHTGTGLREAA